MMCYLKCYNKVGVQSTVQHKTTDLIYLTSGSDEMGGNSTFLPLSTFLLVSKVIIVLLNTDTDQHLP